VGGRLIVGIGLGDFGVAKWGMRPVLIRPVLAGAGLLAGLLFSTHASAQSATWLASPGSSDFNTAANWSPAAVPTGTASFGFSNTTALSFSADASIGGFTLNPGASAYNFTVGAGRTVSFTGAGISVNGGSATFTNAFIVNFDNASTAGTATINNNNTLAFHNSATAGGSTIVNNDFLQFFDGTSAGSSALTNNHDTSFFATSTAGSANISNSSTVGFFQTSTAGSATITNNISGQTQFGQSGGIDTSTAGNATIINNHGTTFFLAHSTAGTATITNTNVGATFFADNSTAGNAIITNTNAETGFQNNSTAGNARITNNNGGIIEFFDAGTSAGNATITNNSGGQLIFSNGTAANSTIINSGSAQLTNTATGGNARLINNAGGLFFINANGPTLTVGSIEGAGTFEITGGAQLTVGTNNLSTTVSGVITSTSPFETLTKVGTGTLTLTGTNTFLGAMTVNGGTLEVDGSIAAASAVFVNAGGTLSGTGIVDPASTQIASGGTLAPGNAANPTGVLTVTGSLSFASSAIYLVQVSGANAGKTNVAGAGFLGGTVNVGVIGGAQANTNYDILHAAGGLNNTTFAGVQSLAPGFAPSLSYSTTDVFLNLTAALGNGGGSNANQQNVANTINGFFNAGGTLPAGFLNLFGLSGAALGNALTQISGETATGSQQTTFNAMTQFMGLLTDPFMNRGGGSGGATLPTGYAEDERLAYAARQKTDAFAMFTKAPPAPFEQRWSVWAAGFGGSQSTSGNSIVGSNNTTSSIAGTAVGADYLISANTIAGFALAGGGTSFSVAGGGTGRSDLFQAGAYVRHNQGPAYVSAALAYGWQDITTNRSVAVAGLDQLRAEFNANAFSGRLEGGYRFVSPATFGIGITPYAAAQFVTFDLPAYAEQAISGTNNFALAYNAKDVTDARSELGIRTDKSFLMPDGILTLRGRLAWAHDYDPDRSIGATFQTLPGASFVVNGAAQAADSALTTASIEMKWRNGWSAAATFEGEFSNVTSSYAGKGVVRYTW
jgi:autotransporter-associated beta strand protein